MRESIPSNIHHTVRNSDSRQFLTIKKCPFSNACHIVRYRNTSSTGCPVNQNPIDNHKRIFFLFGCKPWRPPKSIIPKTYQTIWSRDFRQIFTTIKSITFNTCHTVWNGNLRQTGTAGKSKLSNACHAIRYRNFCYQLSVYIKIGTTMQWIRSSTINIFQIGAVMKSFTSNTCHAVWYRDCC